MCKNTVSAAGLQEAAAFLRYDEKQRLESCLTELEQAFPEDELENSRLRTWNSIKANLEKTVTQDSTPERRMDHTVKKRFLIAVTVIILLFGMTLAVSAGAREMVLELHRKIGDNHIIYGFLVKDNGSAEILPHLNADRNYDGFELKNLVDLPKFRDEYYKNDVTGDTIAYSCAATDSITGFGVRGNVETRENVNVHGFDGDLYHATEKVRENTLIWVDTDQSIAFMISTTLSIEDIYYMVELIYQ